MPLIDLSDCLDRYLYYSVKQCYSEVKFRHKLKKIGETTRPFKYDLNQIPYDYMVDDKYSQVFRSGRQNA